MLNTFINTIRMLFQDMVVFVDINNQVTQHFDLHRGVHKGCPLAPYLFISSVEALSVEVLNALRIGHLKGIALPQCNSQQIISQYASDTSFSMRKEESNVDNLVGIMHKFGLEINWHRSAAYW